MEESVKPKNTSKVKEKRLAYSQDGAPKKTSKHQGLIKNDIPPVSPSRSLDGSSPVKKLLREAGKIMKIGIEKDFALLERDTAVQNSSETIDNLRKNILFLQMEYEKLDQSFQREISYRTEVIKRMDATRELVESVVQCSNILAASVKQLEDDKLKIAELYELIFQNQKEIEAKHAQTEKFFQEQDILVKKKMDEIKEFQTKIISQNSDTVSQLNKKLEYTGGKLKITTEENEKLQRKILEIQESSNRLQMFLEQQKNLNNLHQESIVSFKLNLKKLKIQRFKSQKLLKSKKKKFLIIFNKNKSLKKNLEKIELRYNESISAIKLLELRNNEWKSKFNKHLEDGEIKRQLWENQKKEFLNQLAQKESDMEDLKTQNKYLNEKILDLTANDRAKQVELDQIQNELSKMLNENLKLRESVTKLNEENENKAKTISELETKTNSTDTGLNSKIEFYKNEAGKLDKAVRELENQLSDLHKKLGFEKLQKEKTSDINNKLEQTLKESYEKITNLEKQLEEKARKIQVLESEKAHAILDGQTVSEKLNKELQQEEFKNNELNNCLERMKYNCEDLKKQLGEAKIEITEKKEKLTELNSLNETLSHTQSDLEKKFASLKKEIEFERKSFEVLEEKHKKAEKELNKMQTLMEENAALKSKTCDLKKALEGTEARLEAYKMVVKKLESERTETKNNHSSEITKLKLELSRWEEAMKKEKLPFTTAQNTVENTENEKEKESEPSKISAKEKLNDFSFSQKCNTKEKEPEMGDVEKWQQTYTPPIQRSKKFMSTPRKVLTSTPQPNFRNLTPIPKKRDPYEFDSDSSAERFDPEKVLKVFNRQKREGNKRTKATK